MENHVAGNHAPEEKKSPRPTLHQVSGLVRLERFLPPREGKYPVALLTVKSSRGFFSQVKALGRLAEKLARDGVSPGTLLYLTGYLTPGDREPWLMLRWAFPIPLPSPLPYPSLEPGELRAEGVFFLGRSELRYTQEGRPFFQGLLGFGGGSIRYSFFLPEGGDPQVDLEGLALLLEGKEPERGKRVFAQGALVESSWTDREGKKRYEPRLRLSFLLPLKANASPSEEGSALKEEELDFPLPEELPF